MSNLPFVIQPRLKPIIERIGSDEAGYIEIERRGYLTAGEKAFVQQVQQQDSGTLKIIGLSRKIANERNLSLEKAYHQVMEIMQGRTEGKLAQSIESEYAVEFQQVLIDLATAKTRETFVHAACLLIHRVDQALDFEEIRGLHPDVINGLSDLYDDEEQRSTKRLIQELNSDDNNEENSNKLSSQLSVDEIEKKQEQDQE